MRAKASAKHTSMSKIHTLRDQYIAFSSQDSFLRKIIVYMVNHRVQEFSDPLTSTLVLMATSPMQMVCCESGILPFKTSLLPVIPYALLSLNENNFVQHIISELSDDVMHETMESSGQYTLSVFYSLSSKVFMCKRQLLLNFMYVMFNNNNVYGDVAICKTLCNIILQRFMARVPVPSEMVSEVVMSFSDIKENTALSLSSCSDAGFTEQIETFIPETPQPVISRHVKQRRK